MKYHRSISQTVNKVVIEKVTCDLCDREAPHPDWPHPWGGGPYGSAYSVMETEVRMRWGEDFPECGSGEEIIFDICPECFDEKLIPFLRSQGARTEPREWSR